MAWFGMVAGCDFRQMGDEAPHSPLKLAAVPEWEDQATTDCISV